MAEKVIIDLEVDSSKAQKGVEDFSGEVQSSNKKQKKSIDDLQDELSKLESARNKANSTKEIKKYNSQIRKTEKRLKKTADAQNLVTKAQGALNIGVRGFGAALKGAGIGLVIGLFAELVELLKSNQKVVDAFSIAFDTLKGVFNEVMKVAEPLVDAFKALMEGDFADAGKAFAQFGENIANMDLGKVGRDSYEAAEGITELKNEIELATAKVEGQVSAFELRREKLRQIRDDDRKSNKERMEASKELQEVIQEQARVEERLALKELKLAREKLKLDEDNYGLKAEVIRKENELTQIQNRLSTETSERLNAERSLRNEINADIEKQKEAEQLEQERKDRAADSEIFRMESLAAKEIENEEYVAAEKMKIAERTEAQKEKFAKLKKKARESESKRERELARMDAQVAIAASKQAFDAAAMLAAEGSAMQKALSIGGIIADSAQAVLGTWAGYSSMGPLGTAGAVAQTALIAATAAKNIQQVMSIQPPPQAKGAGGGGSVSAGGGGSIAAPQVPAPQFNLQGDTGQNQLAQTINRQGEQPTKAYVVSSEVSSAQQLDRLTESNATL